MVYGCKFDKTGEEKNCGSKNLLAYTRLLKKRCVKSCCADVIT